MSKYSNLKSVHDILKVLVEDKSVLWFETINKYNAIEPFSTAVDIVNGERGIRSAKAMKVSKKIVSGCSIDGFKPDNIVLTMIGDTSTDTGDGVFGCTTRIISSSINGRRINRIKIFYRGKSEPEIIDFSKLPDFTPLSNENRKVLAEEIKKISLLEEKIKKCNSKISYLKTKAVKSKIFKINKAGINLEYLSLDGISRVLCEKDGAPVEMDIITQQNGVSIRPQKIEKIDKIKAEIEDLPILMHICNRLKSIYKKKYMAIRPLELSVLNNLPLFQSEITLNGTKFSIIRKSKNSKTHKPNTPQRLKNKEIGYINKSIVKNSWSFSGEFVGEEVDSQIEKEFVC